MVTSNEGHTALVAAKWFLLGVDSLMYSPVRAPCESHPAVLADKLLAVQMDCLMAVKVKARLECLRTHMASVRSGNIMDFLMMVQVFGTVEWLIAFVARVWPVFWVQGLMTLQMSWEVSLCGEGLTALVAAILVAGNFVKFLVSFEVTLVGEFITAVITREASTITFLFSCSWLSRCRLWFETNSQLYFGSCLWSFGRRSLGDCFFRYFYGWLRLWTFRPFKTANGSWCFYI